jgi:hypothetical protein
MSDDTTISNFRLTARELEILDLLVEEAKKTAPPELAKAVSRTSVLRKWLAGEAARIGSGVRRAAPASCGKVA